MTFEVFIYYVENLKDYSTRTNKLIDILNSSDTYIDQMLGDLGTLIIESVNKSSNDKFYEEFWDNINNNVTESDWKDYYIRLKG